jgi:anti-sigma regulatory factor (Ser/Thr protein kinase)
VIPLWDQVLTGERIGGGVSPSRAAGGDVTCSRRLSLPAAAQAPGLARRATCETLLSWGIEHLQETAALLVSELVTNAVQHTQTGSRTIVLRLDIAPTTLRIEVKDTDPRWMQPRRRADVDETGFGLVLVEALARGWGLRHTAAGKAVWAELETTR